MKPLHPEVSIELEVPFHDVDMLHVVWHGHYYRYFEVARTALLRSRGLDGHALVHTGYMFMVIESKCRHTHPLRFGHRFRVSAAFKDVDYRINVRYEIFNMTTERRAAYGHTVLATVDAQGQLLLRTPDALLERLRH